MLNPIPFIAAGVGSSLASRAVERPTPEPLRRSYRSLSARTKPYLKALDTLEIDNPVSWVRCAFKVFDAALLSSTEDDPWTFCKERELRTLHVNLDFLYTRVLERGDARVVSSSDWAVLFEVELDDITVWLMWFPDNEHGAYRMYVPRDMDRTEARRALSSSFWGDDECLEVGVSGVGGEISARPFDLGGYTYHGELLEVAESWRTFSRASVRRNVLLHGRPGCGKSTFCYHVARERGGRVLVLSPTFVSGAEATQWRNLLDVANPDVIIVNDVDRVGAEKLGKRLDMFEESGCQAPLTLFTSNNLAKFPRAMLRPGRIDQLLHVDPPGEDIIRETLNEMAREESVSIPDSHYGELRACYDLSGAHAREMLRRVKVLGWGHAASRVDVTFNDLNDHFNKDDKESA